MTFLHSNFFSSGFKSLDSNKIDLTITLSLNLSRMVKDALYFQKIKQINVVLEKKEKFNKNSLPDIDPTYDIYYD